MIIYIIVYSILFYLILFYYSSFFSTGNSLLNSALLLCLSEESLHSGMGLVYRAIYVITRILRTPARRWKQGSITRKKKREGKKRSYVQGQD
jgi:hypothetical protein